jgi:hypothetical protein
MNKILVIIVITGTMMTTSISTKADNQWLGPVIGGIAGGFLGNKIGGGTGKMVATAAGAVGGFLLGQEAVRQPAHSPTPVNTQGDTIGTFFIGGPCDRYVNLGVKAACSRGVAERAAQAQVQIEREAYQIARGNYRGKRQGDRRARYARW